MLLLFHRAGSANAAPAFRHCERSEAIQFGAIWMPRRSAPRNDPEKAMTMKREDRLKRLRFRAWHRGTKEADMLVGGYFDEHYEGWSDAEIGWFEAFLEEQDVDIMAWAIGTAVPPERYLGPMMQALQTLDYITHAK
jgi:antitoxin CptB